MGNSVVLPLLQPEPCCLP